MMDIERTELHGGFYGAYIVLGEEKPSDDEIEKIALKVRSEVLGYIKGNGFLPVELTHDVFVKHPGMSGMGGWSVAYTVADTNTVRNQNRYTTSGGMHQYKESEKTIFERARMQKNYPDNHRYFKFNGDTLVENKYAEQKEDPAT